MDIKLIPVGNMAGQFVFPSLPEEVKESGSARYQSYSVLSLGSVEMPKGTDTKEISWDGVFFGISKRQESIVKADYWQEPVQCVDILRKWMEEGTVLNLIITGIWVNMDVTIARFAPAAYGGLGNISYSITLKAHRNLVVYTTKDLKINNESDRQKTRKGGRRQKEVFTGDTYVIREGDTLWKIACYCYRDGSQWQKIWKKNKKTLNRAAKYWGFKSSKNGELLFAGTKITIP